MNLAELERRLIVAARAHPPGEAVPYAFEKRIMARVKGMPASDWSAFWARALWRSALSCLAVVMLVGAWTRLRPPTGTGGSDLTQQFETTLFAGVDSEGVN